MKFKNNKKFFYYFFTSRRTAKNTRYPEIFSWIPGILQLCKKYDLFHWKQGPAAKKTPGTCTVPGTG